MKQCQYLCQCQFRQQKPAVTRQDVDVIRNPRKHVDDTNKSIQFNSFISFHIILKNGMRIQIQQELHQMRAYNF